MQSYVVLSAALTFALWVQDSASRTSAGSWHYAPVLQAFR